ncbi:MAG: ROK family protein [Solobacterium sp.]|nr:ROK family protein [Solobacterium sp.]
MADKTDLSALDEFKKWALEQKSPEYEISFYRDRYDHIRVANDCAEGTVAFYPLENFDVVEMSVINTNTHDAVFYLHFELKDLEHARELFTELTEAVIKQKNSSVTKVLLCCSSGITTHYFLEKLKSANELLNLEMEFSAVNYGNLYVKAQSNDVIILAPQISYEYEKVREILSSKIVNVIPTSVYGSYDVSGLLQFVRKLIAERDQQQKEKMLPAERMEFKNTPRMLIISVIVEYESIRFVYRIYDAGTVTHQDEVIKRRFDIPDLEDMLDFELARFPGIEMICINSPGVFYKGRMTFRSAGIIDVDVEKRLTEKYGRRVIFINDANAMALGFYGLQKKTRNLSFYFHPHAARTAGVGNVVNGMLFTGMNNIAGEMQYLHKIIHYSDDPDVLLRTPEGTIEIVSKYLISLIATFNPEQIIIFCDMVYDLTELKKEIAKYVQEEFIPELIKVDDVIEYMFVGGMMQCVQELTKQRMNHAHRRHTRSGSL